MYSSEYSHTGYATGYPPHQTAQPPQPPGQSGQSGQAGGRHGAAQLAGPAGAPGGYEQWRSLQDQQQQPEWGGYGVQHGVQHRDHLVPAAPHRTQELYAQPAAPHRTQEHQEHHVHSATVSHRTQHHVHTPAPHRTQEHYIQPVAPHRTQEHHIYSPAPQRQQRPQEHHVLPAAPQPHRTQQPSPHTPQTHQSLPQMAAPQPHSHPRHDRHDAYQLKSPASHPAFSFKQPLPTYAPLAATHGAAYPPPSLHPQHQQVAPPQPSRLQAASHASQYHPAPQPSQTSAAAQYPYRQDPQPPQHHHSSIIQYNPQYTPSSSVQPPQSLPFASQPYPPRPASLQPDGVRHSSGASGSGQPAQRAPSAQPHALAALAAPPRPHSVQPARPSTPQAARPQPPLTPHPSYPYHHPTCSCPVCRPGDTPYGSHARVSSFSSGRGPGPHHTPASTSVGAALAAPSPAPSAAPAPPSAPPRLECEVPAKRMRAEARVETVSPVDLSVRTVRRSADSTAWRAEAEHDGDVQAEACDSTAPPSRAAMMARVPRTAVMPRVPFMPDFSVAHFHQQRDARREEQDQLRRQREDEEHLHHLQQHPQVSLPGVATLPLPWPAIARPSLTGVAAMAASTTPESSSHSALLPRFSSNRSSLYPSSSAPALPPHAADPTGYLLPSLRSLPLVPPLAPPDVGVPEAPRIRTKAEMKMLGDAAAEAVRSWLATSHPEVPADASEHPCEASTSGLSAPTLYDEHLLDSAEVTARAPLDAALPTLTPTLGPAPAAPGARYSVLRSPGQDSGLEGMPRLEAMEPAAPVPAPAPAPTSIPVSAPAAVLAPAEGSLAPVPVEPAAPEALLSTPTSSVTVKAALTQAAVAPGTPENLKEEGDDSQSAWAQSCLDFELELGASETKKTSKGRFQSKTLKADISCDKTLDLNAVEKLSVSPDSLKNVSRGQKTVVSRADSSKSGVSETRTCPKRKPRPLVISDSESSKSSIDSDDEPLARNKARRSASNQDKDCPKSIVQTRSTKSNKSTSPEVKPKKSVKKEAEEAKNTCSKKLFSTEAVLNKSPRKTRSSSSKESPPIKRQHLESGSSDNESVTQYLSKSLIQNTPVETRRIRLRTKVVEVEKAYCLRPKGDGSDFRPGWEEEVFQYKRSLRMPHILINMSKGSAVSEAENSKPSSICSTSESALEGSPKKHCRKLESEAEALSNCVDVESEDASSSVSLPFINRRGKKHSIIDQLVEKVSKASANKSIAGSQKTSQNSSGKSTKSTSAVDRSKSKQANSDIKETTSLNEEEKVKTNSLRKKDSIRAVFGTEKTPPSKTKSQATEENKKSKSKSVTTRRKIESVPIRQMSLRKRNLVIPKTSGRKSSRTGDIEGIVLRPRNAQQVATSRTGLRTAALVRRSKVVLNLKNKKNQNIERRQSGDGTDDDVDNDDNDNDKSIMNTIEAARKSLLKDETSETTVVKKRVIRRKFRSGFDYIRKSKKKKVKKEDVKKAPVEKEKVAPIVERIPLTEEQIQVTLRNWVINRSHGDTVLHRAARLGYAEVAQYAIDKLKMSPCVADNAGYTPLHEAARRGHVDLSKILLEHGADVSCSAIGGIRPLHEAAESNQVEMLRLLLEYGADPTLATYGNDTPLSIVEPDSEAYELLTHHLADVQGLNAPPWKYHGPSKIFDLVTYRGDVALQSPPSFESDADSEINVFSSEVIPPPLYTFHGEPTSQVWVLVKDLMKALNISTEDELFCRLAVQPEDEPTSSQNLPIRTREVSIDDFLQKTKAVTFPAPESNLPLSGCMTRLVEFSNEVRALLNEEVTTFLG